MSKLYGSIDADASKTMATRRGHRAISAHIRGWHDGVSVEVRADENGNVTVNVYRTGGSNSGRVTQNVASWREGFDIEVDQNAIDASQGGNHATVTQ